MNKQVSKRVDIISIKQVKEGSFLYKERCIDSPKKAGELFAWFLKGLDREAFAVAYLNTKGEVNAIQMVSVGTLNSSMVHPREVYKGALTSNSASIIVCHNHPSNNTKPSPEDDMITKRLVSAGALLGVPLLDHVIINDVGEAYSYKEEGKI